MTHARRTSTGRRGVVVGLAVVLSVAAIACALLWRQYKAAPVGLFVDSVERFRADATRIPGITSVDEAEQRAGDLTFRSNAFIPLKTDLPTGSAELEELVRAVAERSAVAQTDTRLMPVLTADRGTIGIAPDADLNALRLRIASTTLAIPDVEAVSVLWPDQGDDLIYDESNARLDVTAQTRSSATIDIAEAALEAVRTVAADASVTVITRVDGAAFGTRLYSWIDDAKRLGHERTVSVDAQTSAESLREIVAQLDAEPGVLGYSVSAAQVQVGVQLGTDAAALAGRLRLPLGTAALVIETMADDRLLPPLRWGVDPATGLLTQPVP